MILTSKPFVRGFIYISILIIIAFIAMIIFISSLNSTTLNNSVNPYLSNYINMAMPESFGFFTKSPKDKRLKFFSYTNNSMNEIDLRANASSNLYGLKRNNRKLIYELGILLRKVPDSIWVDIESIDLPKLELNNLIPHEISSKKSKITRIDKGDYIIYYYDPIPWELNKYQKQTNGRISYIKIK